MQVAWLPLPDDPGPFQMVTQDVVVPVGGAFVGAGPKRIPSRLRGGGVARVCGRVEGERGSCLYQRVFTGLQPAVVDVLRDAVGCETMVVGLETGWHGLGGHVPYGSRLCFWASRTSHSGWVPGRFVWGNVGLRTYLGGFPLASVVFRQKRGRFRGVATRFVPKSGKMLYLI